MSGIAGIIYPDPFQTSQLINPMLRVLSRDRPSEHDSISFKNVEVGACGQKIASTEKRNLYVGLDGQLNNALELNEKLRKEGVKISNVSDAHLILHAYEKWGMDFLQHIDGEFALFLFDATAMKLILARDRIGRKPLYWYHNHGYFIFGSQLKALLGTGIIPQTPALDAMSSYLYFGYIPQDMTPIQSINKLLPAYYLQINQDSSKRIEAYWSYSSYFKKSHHEKKEVVVQRLNDLIENAVKKELPKDSPSGCFVSGGLGSATIAYYVNKLSDKTQSYSVAFHSESDEDINAAKLVAEDLGITQELSFVTPGDCVNNLVKIVWELDEPLADPNVLAAWKLAESAAKHTRVVFSGMGSDELLAGHCRYTTSEQPKSALNKFKQQFKSLFLKAVLPVLKILFKPAVYSILKQARTNPWQFDYLKQNALFNEKLMGKAAPKLAKLFDPEVFLHKFHHLSRIHSTFGSYLYFDIKTRLPDCYILQYERLTEAHDLKWHTPFLDRSIVEYLAALSEPESIGENESGQYLKGLLSNIYPENFLNRPKHTRKAFLKEWAEDPTIKKMFSLLPTGRLAECGFVSQKWIEEQLATPETSKKAFPYLWALLSLEIWYRLFISGPIQSQPPNTNVISLLKEM